MNTVRGVFLACVTGGALAILPADARAQTSATPGETEPAHTSDLSEQAKTIESLLDRLSKAESKSEAKSLERQVVTAWNASGSDTVDLLVARAGGAIKAKDFGVALQYLDTAITIQPDFAEAWNMRATVYYLIDEYELSLADIRQVLVRQPRHFGALSGLGLIFRQIDEPEKALEAYRQVEAVHPYFGTVRESIEKLEKEVGGKAI